MRGRPGAVPQKAIMEYCCDRLGRALFISDGQDPLLKSSLLQLLT